MFANGNDFAIFQCMFINFLAVNVCAIGAVKIFNKWVIEDGEYFGMITADSEIINMDIVVCFTPYCHGFLIKWIFVQSLTIKTKY